MAQQSSCRLNRIAKYKFIAPAKPENVGVHEKVLEGNAAFGKVHTTEVFCVLSIDGSGKGVTFIVIMLEIRFSLLFK